MQGRDNLFPHLLQPNFILLCHLSPLTLSLFCIKSLFLCFLLGFLVFQTSLLIVLLKFLNCSGKALIRGRPVVLVLGYGVRVSSRQILEAKYLSYGVILPQIIDRYCLYEIAALQCLADLLEASKASSAQIRLEMFAHRFCNRPSILVLWSRPQANLVWVNLQAEPFI